MVVLGEEVGGPASSVVGIQWKRAPGGGGECTFYDFTIYMGLTQLDELGIVFLDNYTPGTRTAVFSRTAWTAAAEVGQWVPVTLDTPFPYDPSTANLIIELEYSGSDAGSVYVWTWDTGAGRCALGEYGGAEAKGVFPSIPHLGLTVQYGLEQDTVAGIKTSLGGWGE